MHNKTLVLFHYFEKDQVYRDNFLHFLYFGYSEKNDYIFIISGEYSINLPVKQNIKYIFYENKNNDFGGYSFALNNEVNIKKYDFYFFINSSVRGPFIPSYCNQLWTECFINECNQEVGIVGSSINILPIDSHYSIEYARKYNSIGHNSHVQSTSYMLPRNSLSALINAGFYSNEKSLEKNEVVIDYEIRMSKILLSLNLNLKCLLPEYNLIDYRTTDISDVSPTSYAGDAHNKSAYFGRTPHPYELIFIKTNRNLFNIEYLNRLSFSMLNNFKDIYRPESQSIKDFIDKLTMNSKTNLPIDLENGIYSSEQILNNTKALLDQYPSSRSLIEKILQS